MNVSLQRLSLGLTVFGLWLSATAQTLNLDQVLLENRKQWDLVPFNYQYYQGLYSKVTHAGFVTLQEIHNAESCNISRESDKRGTFMTDPDVMGEAIVQKQDYKNTEKFSRGHLTPSGMFKTAESAGTTFFLTNIAPQNEVLNTGTWRRMEDCVRDLIDLSCLDKSDLTWGVITGVINQDPENSAKRMLNGKIQVPTHFYKIVFTENLKSPIFFAYVMPNEAIKTNDNIRKYQVSLAEVEQRSGLHFFSHDIETQFDRQSKIVLPFGTGVCMTNNHKHDRQFRLAVETLLKNH